MVDFENKIACTVFTEGCNFRCPFCHNAALVVGVGRNGAIDENEVFAYLEKRKGLVDAVCVTGGEPTLQKGLLDFLIKVKQIGYLVKLDSNGTMPKVIKDLVERGLVDYVAMDIKNSLENYGKTVGISDFDTTAIKESIDYLLSGAVDYEFRTTLVGGEHTAENVESIAKTIAGAKRFFLQKFVDSGGCIESGLKEISEDDAKAFAEIARKYVSKVELRGY